ncbi:LamG domain-containing protein [bacterium]|nr:LamG domain-containing protein [bacterium]
MKSHHALGFFACFLLLFALPAFGAAESSDSGLLFYLSGDGGGDGFTADYAHGDPEPAYLNEYVLIPDGARGKAFRAPHSEEKLMAYLAPGNIYAERGTISFYWRPRDPVGKMPFKIFYVSYCDQSSLDMTWLRIDYNGSGYDAFVTDANMARIRVSYKPSSLPPPEKWTHFALTWDETQGVRLYVDGALAAKKDTTVVFYAGLGLFTPHGRFSTPGTVTSNCGHLRGGDIDEISIYDRMLSEDQVKNLAQGQSPGITGQLKRTLTDPRYRDEWWYRYGWNRPGDTPPYLSDRNFAVRAVEIHDAYDQKKWAWRSNDGIRETTWPDVYNRSSLPGRSDYFIEPDWYCYSTSGKSITYTLPEEPWNYCEITGAAYGNASGVFLDKESQKYREEKLLSRPKGQERTFHLLGKSYYGGKIRYENDVRETPLAEFQVYNVTPGSEPVGVHKMTYLLTGQADPDNPSLGELLTYIEKRFLPDERQIMLALPGGAPRNPKKAGVENPLPLVHILVPGQFRNEGPRTNSGAYAGFHYELVNLQWGLDGIAVDIPGLQVKPTHGEYFLLNIQVKDPLWPNRNMIDFSFSVKPGEPRTLWLDTRDRILPDGCSLYITIAGSGADFGPSSLDGGQIRLVFKEREQAIPEHEKDRFTQVRDNFAANLSETFPQRLKLEYLARFYRDITDLFRVNPDHIPGRYYWSTFTPEQGWPLFEQPEAPSGVPLWAFRQTEIVRQWRYFLNWWIDNRQIENGELGGGLSDDGDFANCMPGLALSGVDTEKITDSLHRLMEAYYANGMFTNGLNTIVTDALHVSEEGTNVQTELMLLEYGNPKLIERIMETSTRYPDITAINKAGHRHFPSRFYSSTFMATENPWCWSSPYSITVLHPGMVLVEFNGYPATMQLIREVGDGYLAHAVKDARGTVTIPREINFITDEGRDYSPGTVSEIFEVLYRWTGEGKYLLRLGSAATSGARVTTDKKRFEDAYARTIQYNAQRMYMGTEGFPWDDGPYITYGSILDDRLGGAPIYRGNQFPRHAVSWKFARPDDAMNLGILVPSPTPSSLKIIAFNLSNEPINASLVGWNVEPGTWEMTCGTDDNGDDMPDTMTDNRTVMFERTGEVTITFPPCKTLIVQMELKQKGIPYWSRPDLGIGNDDVRIKGGKISVTVHSLGSVDAPSAAIALVDGSGKMLSKAQVAALKAPLDFKPKTAGVVLAVPKGISMNGCRVVIDPDRELTEITRYNNTVDLEGIK